MKILGINSSPNGKKSQTLRLVNAVLNGGKSMGAEIEFVDLRKLKIEYCIGCRKCFETGFCIFKDDYQELLQKMLDADGMVWGSPNYSFKLGVALASDIESKRPYFDQRVAIDANRRDFQRKVRQYKDEWKHQYEYWEKQNWR
jgi:multimeric flavodoxin WrbA